MSIRLPDPAPADQRPEAGGPSPSEGEALREAMRRIASPVVVVTTVAGGEARGATIGSFTSVSLAPPLVSFNVTHGSQLHDALAAEAPFAVHLLAADQAALATHFALPGLSAEAQFAPFSHRPGVPPVLDDVLAALVCAPAGRLEAGDHTVVLGRVVEVIPGREGAPLLYYAQTYRGVGEEVEMA